ncbi:hypothetical protein DDV96_08185 [Marixanthomonas spongiae]|uniref:Uncharacterized protein n=2 Tax=Marixanthomonas spongiae TaxID=2174845 RepID=A0A2U0I2R2_9FLAO|nr:hypothetical protein DDV96_08185 [Marixanthomonas spongiae]
MAATSFAQDTLSNYRTKKTVIADTVVVDSLSINPSHFRVLDKTGAAIDSLSYSVDYENGTVVFSDFPTDKEGKTNKVQDSITIEYLRYPLFLTREYYTFDKNLIVEKTGAIEKLYSLDESTTDNTFTPFDGLNTVGSISRGVTIGNNQNAVLNSQLDLQITGKLSDKVSIRASIQDANIPTQEGGYSQSLDEFDQIFIELYSDNWKIRAGDVDLENNNSYFGQFTKKVQGIALGGTLEHENGAKTSAFASGAIVKGVFQRSEFTGQEGNQGPYKLVGPNGELFILIVSGSERVYVNGLLLQRGESNDYVIDYNAGEITFNPTYPITANMRITVEYQYTDRNYTRFIGYGGGNYSSEKLDIGTYIYSENDAKNQPLQQNLSEEQVAILKAAGDDMDKMIAPSAVPDSYSENKILYKKELIDGQEVFVFSNDPEDELFSVRFTLVGNNQGNYVVSDQSAISRIFEYVAPINGVPQGNYEPIIQLNAPTKLQIGGLNGQYRLSEKTNIGFEVAGSRNDLNLFSNLDDGNNDGFAGRLTAKQQLLNTQDTLQVNGYGTLDFINSDFRTIERLYNIEFNRDWNLIDPMGDQRFITAGASFSHPGIGNGSYEFQNLDFSENFSGVRHVVSSAIQLKKLRIRTNGSLLNSKSDSLESKFTRLANTTSYSFNKGWVGGKIAYEDNQVRTVNNDKLTPVSQKFQSYEAYAGIGDSTNVFVEAGYRHQINDSIHNATLQKVNSSNTYFMKSKLINSDNAQLSVFANYRVLKQEALPSEDSTGLSETTSPIEQREEQLEKSLNSRIIYSQGLFNNGIRLNTTLESNNGVVPRQEFTYVKVDPGQGVYTWIDYNNNGVQELEEFEVAQFQDQAEYVRVLLPNQLFVKIRQNKFSQIVTLNPQQWSNKEGIFKVLSKFYNQISYLIDRKVKRNNDGFNINPFEDGGDDQLGLNLNFRNALFFNRGKQRYTTSYTYIASSSDNLLSVGLQKNTLQSHQLKFNHKVWEGWLFNLEAALGNNESTSENFPRRNFKLDTYEFEPKVSYLLNPQTRFDVFYQFANKDNTLGDMEVLNQQKLGVSFAYSNAEKISVNGEFNYITNDFSGSAFSPVAYQMLEGLQPGTNFTWQLLFQKRITKYLDANLSYFGRKSETSKTVHTGSVQLRAYF